MVSSYSVAQNPSEFNEQIQNKASLGLGLTDTEYANGIWFGTYSDRLEGSFQGPLNSVESAEYIRGQFNLGFDLVDLEYVNGAWYSAFNDNPGTSYYIPNPTLDAFTGQVQQQLSFGIRFS